MNCGQYQKKVVEALAAGEVRLPRQLEEHRRECAACAAYCESQTSLFLRLEEEMKALANEAVPASLIPRVRMRLKEEPEPTFVWLPGWAMGSVAVALLAASLSFVLYRPTHEPQLSEKTPVASDRPENVVPVERPQRSAVAASLKRGSKHAATASAFPEVIILPEERAAFARFVNELPEGDEAAVTLTPAVPAEEEANAEIVALGIEGLEVQSLDPGWE